MEFKTSISKMTDDDHIIRGEKLSKLMQGSFSDAIYLILKGDKPSKVEAQIFESILVSIIDHGMGTASSMASRFVASTGNSVNSAIGTGILALGDYHGGAIENAMKQLKDVKNAASFVEQSLKNKEIIYGFGHKVYKDFDPRAKQILDMCDDLGFKSEYLDLVKDIESEIEKQKGKKIVLNVDGVIAAVLMTMEFTPNAGKAFFVIGRTPGLSAQVIEELENESPVRRISEDEIKYEGK